MQTQKFELKTVLNNVGLVRVYKETIKNHETHYVHFDQIGENQDQ